MTQQFNQAPNYGPPVQSNARVVPTVWPTILVTFFFGLFGLIPAIMHSSRAVAAGKPSSDYWLAFFLTALLDTVIWFFVLRAMMASVPTFHYGPYYGWQPALRPTATGASPLVGNAALGQSASTNEKLWSHLTLDLV